MPAVKKVARNLEGGGRGSLSTGGAARAVRKAVFKVKPKPNVKAEPKSNVKVKPAAKTKGNPPNPAKKSYQEKSSWDRVWQPAEGGYGEGPAKAGKTRTIRVQNSVNKNKKK